ncbi:Ubiquitin carboxyl-terminal hydrolase 23 [Hirschfeldia incana]|nr:Ubiquitin carboxyl-terminal hydrolase 23 [Hirschfeldia incana]
MIQTDRDPPSNGSSASAVSRKIEFHPARKPFSGFSNKKGSDFKMETLNSSSANKRAFSSSPSGKRSDGSDPLENGLDRELTFSRTIRKIGAGLENLGNTCFLNSVVQCLTYTEPLAAYLQDVGHEKRCHVAGFCALCAMQKHVRLALQASGRIVAPKYLVSNLRCVSRNFRNCRQEDAHEYMINLLECMHKCCLPSGVPSESSDAYRSSLVHKIFGGSLRSQVKCAQCSHCSDKFDPFLDLSLDISKADSLQRALSRFTAVELLDDGAKVYQCERCKQKVRAVKQLTVSKAPYVLTVHLKRFEAHRSEKIDKKVQFASSVDMKPFVSGPYAGNLKYTLYGVLVHYGRSSNSGHYACFVRTSSGMWYSLDDNRVIQVSEKTVFNQKAYMLFYVRDRQNPAPKNTATVVKKETSKESLATNRASLNILSNRNDQVNGSASMKACSLKAPVANGKAALRSCDQGAPAVLPQKDLNAKETQKDPPSSVEAKEILKMENGSAPSKPCDLRAPAVLTHKDLNTKETLQKEVPLPQANGEVSLVKEGSKAAPACPILIAKDSPLQGGSTKTQNLINLPTSVAKDGNSIDEKNMVNNLNQAANSLKVNVGNSPIEEAVRVNQTLGHHLKESATSVESMKASSDEGTRTTPRKTRKGNMKALQVGLKSFKLALGVRKKKKQKKGRSSALAVKVISEKLPSKKRATGKERKSASGSACLNGKENRVIVHDEKTMSRNGNMLRGSPTGELKERTNQNGAVLASVQEQTSKSSDMSEANQNAKRKRESSKKEQNMIQKEQTTILTRGLPETVVAKWDEEVSASKTRKSEDSRIGYVPDEWDEEYDRGKKKKIRMKEEMYAGPNPFQLIASKKQQTDTKKKWTQRMNTAKTGFRI